ncbi:extracellular solute-binding protein [Pseudoprimorskyibacter insulae]|uniref:Uncharacterized protein n=1 Tax=Pseudoprimorskyibacter insulae TaxID=1695997 RepID=A0A2R8B0E0_9RHOB|nr:extracellular solute-binding protein [Pseudoprimorskyibacter insulae]SPF81594.1 hypothetical protein PRI8871_03419 [Pseudoprimorskyibacter insulae]
MMEHIILRGMTWSDPRGYDPVVAAAQAFAALSPGVEITWDKRSLQGFESTPVPELAAQYDLMIIDHPHVGAAQAAGCLLPLDLHAKPWDLTRLAGETVGKSYASYTLGGQQWALPIDAAAQVQAIRPDKRSAPAQTFDQVLTAARNGTVIWPLRPPHNLMSFFTLSANIGSPCAVTPGPLLPGAAGIMVLEAMQALHDLVDPACTGMDPIAALDALADSATLELAPYIYLYAPYGRTGYRSHRIGYHDIPALGPNGPLGSALGGTGIAVSAQTKHPETATAFAIWLASAKVQSGLYAQNNGQPGNAVAWGNDTVNRPTGNTYAQTRMTHEAAWLRPRHDGYMGFQHDGADILTDALSGRTSHQTALAALNDRFNESFPND